MHVYSNRSNSSIVIVVIAVVVVVVYHILRARVCVCVCEGRIYGDRGGDRRKRVRERGAYPPGGESESG